MSDAVSTIGNQLCAACACCCDDLALAVDDGRTVFAANACKLAESRLQSSAFPEQRAATIDGHDAPLEEAIDRAAQLLNDARLPVVFGCADSTVETQVLAVKIARRVGGVFDSPALPNAPLFTDVGRITCSLGEAKNRADVIVIWNCDPTVTHPRLFSHFLLEPAGRFRPRGRRDRTLIVVGSPRIAQEFDADESFSLADGVDFTALWTLRTHLRRGSHSGLKADWHRIAELLTSARFGVLVIDQNVGPRAIEAAHALATELQRRTRFYVLVLPSGGNAVGLSQVVTWLTGRSAPVCFARPEPIFGSEFRVQRLVENGGIDVVLNVNGEFAFEKPSRIAQIVLSSRLPATSHPPAVAIRTADFPISDRGTVFRLDGIALPLRPAIPSSAPSQFAVLNQIAQRLRLAAN